MKFLNICLIFISLALLCSVAFAQEESGPKRLALPRRPLGKGAKPASTTAAPPPPPAEGDEGDYPEEGQDQYGDEGEEVQASSTSTTTTEAPKKIGPVIRPFRSNDDLLNSLKRRQMNAKKNKVEKPTPKSKPVPVDDGEEEEESAPAPAPSKSFKANPALNRRKLTKPGKAENPAEDVATAESEQSKDETRVKRPQSFGSLRRRT